MKKIISGLLSVALLFSVCGVCLASSNTPAGTALEGTYVTVSENSVETSETVVYEYTSIKSDLQGVNTDSERMSESSAGGALSKLQKALAGIGVSFGGGLIFVVICVVILL